jgi:hypothetical protein
MIPRYLRIVYWTLVAAIVAMAVVLAVSRHRDHLRILAMRDQSPIPAPALPADTYFGSKLAVVNLTKTFADAHDSGIESEDLTLRAVIATLHANFADIAQVRFLVDGQTRATLAGHADLSRAYDVSDPEKSIHTAAQ